MEMDSSRRSAVDRSREPDPKKPRLSDDMERVPVAGAGQPSNRERPFPPSRAGQPSDPRFRAAERERDHPSAAVPAYHPQPHQQELLAQYKTAIAELTFNSKPIITNLTIIAGENLPSARAIASIVCANILEVPSEQKLPSLYLLDSIVKNIGRDYIKFFASRLPDVFCKAYKQVDSSVHQSMKHLFRTWKAYFPAGTLQIIEKELGFFSIPNGSARAAVSKPDSQTLRPAGIHVNPKYLEARQLTQHPIRAKELGSNEIGGGISQVDNSERPTRATTFGSASQWSEMSLRIANGQRSEGEASNISFVEKQRNPEQDFSSDYSRKLVLGVERVKEKDGHENSGYLSGSVTYEFPACQRSAIDSSHYYKNYQEAGSTLADHKQPALHWNTNSRSTSENWKNSEEEEFMWENINSRPKDYGGTVPSARGERMSDNADKTSGISWDKRLQPERDHVDSHRNKLDAFSQSLNIPKMEDKISSSIIAEGNILPPRHPDDFDTRIHKDGSADSLSKRNAIFDQHTSGSLTPSEPISLVTGFGHIGSKTSGQSNSQSSEQWNRSTQSSIQESLHRLSQSQGQQSHGILNLKPTLSQPPRNHPSLTSSTLLMQSRHNPVPLAQHDLQQQKQSRRSPPQGYKSLPPPAGVGISSSGLPETSQSSSSAVDAAGFSVTGNLLDAIMKSKLFPKASLSNFQNVNVQPPLPSGPPPPHAMTPSGHSLASPLLPCPPVMPPLPPGPPPSQSNTSLKTSSADISAPNPLSSLLQSLVAKGLISSSDTDNDLSNQASGALNSSAMPPPNSLASETGTSSSAIEHSLRTASSLVGTASVPSCAEAKELIGIHFKQDIIRERHTLVIASLFDDFGNQCSKCGLRFERKELGKHFQRHVLGNLETIRPGRTSRRWFAHASQAVHGNTGPSDVLSSPSSFDDVVLTTKDHEPTVPADESQCICALCGEPFIDFYSDEMDAWVYRGAVYLNSSREQNARGNSYESMGQSPIVHAKCIEQADRE